MADSIKNISVQGDIIPVEDTYAREKLAELTTEIENIPKKTSQLTNDSGFITSIPTIPKYTSQLTNDSNYITLASIPTQISQFNNDANYITASQAPSKTSDLENDAGFVLSSTLTNYYYTKTEVDDAIDSHGGGGSVDLKNYYKKTETYSAEEIDAKIESIDPDLSNYYTKSETDAKIEEHEPDLSAYYTSAQVDTKLSAKADTTTLDSYTLKTDAVTKDDIEALDTTATDDEVNYVLGKEE